MYRGTTPTITLKINTDFDFDYIKQVWFTVAFMSNVDFMSKKVTKTIEDVVLDNDKKTISITLSQEETLLFAPGNVSIQVRILTKNDEAFATPIKTAKFEQILEEGVMGG
jgi:hypothetical protein